MTTENFHPTNNRIFAMKKPLPAPKPGVLILDSVKKVHVEATVISVCSDYTGPIRQNDTIFFSHYAGISLDCFENPDLVIIQAEEVLGFIPYGR